MACLLPTIRPQDETEALKGEALEITAEKEGDLGLSDLEDFGNLYSKLGFSTRYPSKAMA